MEFRHAAHGAKCTLYRIVNGRVAKVGKASTKSTPRLTAYQVQRFKGDAELIAQNGLNGFADSKGVKHPPLTLAQAWEEMRMHGIPETIAIQALRRAYKVQANGVAIGADVNPDTNPNAAGPVYP